MAAEQIASVLVPVLSPSKFGRNVQTCHGRADETRQPPSHPPSIWQDAPSIGLAGLEQLLLRPKETEEDWEIRWHYSAVYIWPISAS